MSAFRLLMPETIAYGDGAFEDTGELCGRFGRVALVVSDPVMQKLGNVARCVELLQRSGVKSVVYPAVDSEPTTRHVDEAMDLCKSHQCEVVVGLGGGSSIDTAKAVAAIRTNGGSLSEYVGNRRLFDKKSLPVIAIPTTAGTGSEVTKVTVIIDDSTHVKMMISQPALLPTVAIVDPLLTVSCPRAVTAATGVDALCHAIEAYISRRATPLTDVFALKAAELLGRNLQRAFDVGSDIEARRNVAYGAMLAGIAFSNASVTLVHGMSRPIGALFHVPHGVSNAMLLPAVLEFTMPSAADRLAEICSVFRPESADQPVSERAQQLVADCRNLCARLEIPNMSKWGIDRVRFDEQRTKMANDALASGSPGNNPRVPTAEEIVELYGVCYSYQFADAPAQAVS